MVRQGGRVRGQSPDGERCGWRKQSQEMVGLRQGERPHVPRHLDSSNSPPPCLSMFEPLSFLPAHVTPASWTGLAAWGHGMETPPMEPALCPGFVGALKQPHHFLQQPSPHTTPYTLSGTGCHLGHSSPKQVSLGPVMTSIWGVTQLPSRL